MTNKEYFSIEAVDQSRLKLMLRSPAHYRYCIDHPVERDTPSLRLGRAVHCLVLQPQLYEKAFAVKPEGDARTAKVKEAMAKLLESMSPGCELLTPAEDAQARAIAAAVLADENAARLLEACQAREFPIIWQDQETGLLCKAKLDGLGGGRIIDLKTTENGCSEAFTRDSYKHLYHLQAAHYVNGCQTLSGGQHFRWAFIAVEKTEPYGVHVFHADQSFLMDGEVLRRELLEKVAECEASGVWPSYGEDLLIGRGAV